MLQTPKSQKINYTKIFYGWKHEVLPLFAIILILFFISSYTYAQGNPYAQGNLSVTLVPKTYVGNYHLSCNGASNGEIEAIISGGTTPYTVLWNTNSTANPLLNLTAGAYSVTIIDAANDTLQASYTLVQPPVLGFSLEVPHFGEYNLQYFGSTLGSIKIGAIGGTPSYSVLWTDNNTELSRDSLAAGTYYFVLSDANGCTINGSKTLTQPAVMAGSVSQIHGTSCFEGDDGKAEASITGGIPPYHYLWDNGNFSAVPEDLTSGVHEVQITDEYDNTLTLQVTISQASEIEAQITKSTFPNSFNVSCYNCFNGTLSAQVSGGNAPYTYEWIWNENSIGTSNNLSNLGGGEYDLVVLDNNSCRLRINTNLREPERQDWGMSGNAGTDPATQFIGTTDSVDVVFKSNGIAKMIIGSDNKITLLGTLRTPDYPSESILRTDANGNMEAVSRSDLKKSIYRPESDDCFLSSPAPGMPQPTPTWTAEPGKIYTCPNVGIGTTNPAFSLDVNGATRSNNLFVSSNNQISTTSIFHVDGNSTLNGAVSIGTTNCAHPDYMLAVNGKIIASEVKVQIPTNGCWPDYVFRSGYQLMSPEELENFILEFNHLPDMPSANQIEAEGINSSEMHMQEVKKLEELALYVIDLNKELKKLRAEIAELKKTK
jgi:hypothetical protein